MPVINCYTVLYCISCSSYFFFKSRHKTTRDLSWLTWSVCSGRCFITNDMSDTAVYWTFQLLSPHTRIWLTRWNYRLPVEIMATAFSHLSCACLCVFHGLPFGVINDDDDDDFWHSPTKMSVKNIMFYSKNNTDRHSKHHSKPFYQWTFEIARAKSSTTTFETRDRTEVMLMNWVYLFIYI